MAQVTRERNAAAAEVRKLEARLKEMHAKLRALSEQVDAIRGKITKQ